jgi:hypothetical protein
MQTKGITTNQLMKTKNKGCKMSDNVKFSVRHSQKQTRSFWDKRLGNIQAHKRTEKNHVFNQNQLKKLIIKLF